MQTDSNKNFPIVLKLKGQLLSIFFPNIILSDHCPKLLCDKSYSKFHMIINVNSKARKHTISISKLGHSR